MISYIISILVIKVDQNTDKSKGHEALAVESLIKIGVRLTNASNTSCIDQLIVSSKC